MKITNKDAGKIARRMEEVAVSHPEDMIANAYARTAQKLASYNTPFAAALDDIDCITIQAFVNTYMKRKDA